MKKQFKLQKLGIVTDLKIKSKLYFLQFKKSFSDFFYGIFSFQVMKFAIPTIALAILSTSYFQFFQTPKNNKVSNSIEITHNFPNKNIKNKVKYLTISRKRVLNIKNIYFKKYSKLRTEKIKLITMK